MKPFIACMRGDLDTAFLVVGFVATGNYVHAVCVKTDGSMTWVPIVALVVEYGTSDWPFVEANWTRPREAAVAE